MNNTTLASRLNAQSSPCVVDVRSGFEYRNGHIPGAIHAPLLKLLLWLARLPADKDMCYVVVCEHGPRAQLAQAVMTRRGYSSVELLDGHMSGWRRKKLPLAQGGDP